LKDIILKDFIKAILLSYSQIFFSYSQLLGVFLLILTFFSPWIGIAGFIGVILSNLLSYLFNYNKEHITKGYLGFNSLLIAMEVAYFFKPSLAAVILLFTVIISTLFLTIMLNHIFYLYFSIPSLTLPFVLMSIVLYFATYNYTGLTLRDSSDLIFNNITILSNFPSIEMFFKSLSIIFFQNRVEVGILISIMMLFYSPTMLFLSVASFFCRFGILFFDGWLFNWC
jgi:urea transporter